MCDKCKKELAEAIADANADLDARGVPADSLFRGMVQVQFLCNMHPELEEVMLRCWPTPACLLQ
jgi:hypothetical protein